MKIKPLYIYLIGFALIIGAIVIFSPSGNGEPQTTSMNSQMPDDDVHRGMKGKMGEGPSKSNLNQDVLNKMKMLEEAIAENPSDTATVKEYADMLAGGHEPDKALELYDKILDVDPHRNDVLFMKTFVYYNKKDLAKAEEITKYILSYDSDNLEAKYNLGAIAVAKGDKDSAKEIWEGLVKNYPGTKTAEVATSSLKRLEE